MDDSTTYPWSPVRVGFRIGISGGLYVAAAGLLLAATSAWAAAIRNFGALMPPEGQLEAPPALVGARVAFCLASVWFMADLGRVRRNDPAILGPAFAAAWFFPCYRPFVASGPDAVLAALTLAASVVWALDLADARLAVRR